MYTVPNQHTIVIHREMPKSDFLQIKNQNWQQMIKETQDYYAFVLYLYFAANANGYTLALSPAAITEATGLPRSTYYKKLQLLKDKGYIEQGKGNELHFYEIPQERRKSGCGSLPHEQSSLAGGNENLAQRQAPLSQTQNSSSQNIEINNSIDNTDKINIDKIVEVLWSEEATKPKPQEFTF